MSLSLHYKQQVKNCHIICFTNSTCKIVTLFALQTAGEKLSHYLLYKQQVKNCHIICFTNRMSPNKGVFVVVFASTGFHSWEMRRTLFLQIIENQCCHCDY
jgi:hypothetical protein